ncbi:hypothetical protein D3C76_1402380 [compost metagenome]
MIETCKIILVILFTLRKLSLITLNRITKATKPASMPPYCLAAFASFPGPLNAEWPSAASTLSLIISLLLLRS